MCVTTIIIVVSLSIALIFLFAPSAKPIIPSISPTPKIAGEDESIDTFSVHPQHRWRITNSFSAATGGVAGGVYYQHFAHDRRLVNDSIIDDKHATNPPSFDQWTTTLYVDQWTHGTYNGQQCDYQDNPPAHHSYRSRTMQQWYDKVNYTAQCLITAPDAESYYEDVYYYLSITIALNSSSYYYVVDISAYWLNYPDEFEIFCSVSGYNSTGYFELEPLSYYNVDITRLSTGIDQYGNIWFQFNNQQLYNTSLSNWGNIGRLFVGRQYYRYFEVCSYKSTAQELFAWFTERLTAQQQPVSTALFSMTRRLMTTDQKMTFEVAVANLDAHEHVDLLIVDDLNRNCYFNCSLHNNSIKLQYQFINQSIIAYYYFTHALTTDFYTITFNFNLDRSKNDITIILGTTKLLQITYASFTKNAVTNAFFSAQYLFCNITTAASDYQNYVFSLFLDYIDAKFSPFAWTKIASYTDQAVFTDWNGLQLNTSHTGFHQRYRLTVPSLDSISFKADQQIVGQLSGADPSWFEVYFRVYNVNSASGDLNPLLEIGSRYYAGTTFVQSFIGPITYVRTTSDGTKTNMSFRASVGLSNNRQTLSLKMVNFFDSNKTNEAITVNYVTNNTARNWSSEFLIEYEYSVRKWTNSAIFAEISDFGFVTKDIFADIAHAVGSVLMNVFNAVILLLQALLLPLILFVVSIIRFVADIIVAALNFVVSALTNVITALIDSVITVLTSLIDVLTDLLDDLLAAITSLVSELINALIDNLGVIIEEIFSLLLSLVDLIIDLLLAIINAIITAFGLEELANSLSQLIWLSINMGASTIVAIINLLNIVITFITIVGDFALLLTWAAIFALSIRETVLDSYRQLLTILNTELPSISIMGFSIDLRFYMIIVPLTVAYLVSIA